MRFDIRLESKNWNVLQSVRNILDPDRALITLFRRCFILILPILVALNAFWEKPADAPLQYQMFCLKHPEQCHSDKIETITYGWAMLQDLKRINRRVNRQIEPKYEMRDIWSVGVKQGDCEDYVLTKRNRLARLGIPSGALRVAIVDTEKGERHAVLIVKTSRGNLVLDNRRSNIIFTHKTGYQFLKMSSHDPLRWVQGSV